MTRARHTQVDINIATHYHCVSRCVRRAFLCGEDPYTGESFEHRKGWLVERLRGLSEIFAVQVCAYAVMSNHFHLVLRIDRELALSWSDEEVVERYARLFKHAEAQLASLGPKQRAERLALWRGRLWDLSWMMRSINESIARRANKEDGCTGRFWEGRFKSQPLLDEAAVLTCMSYVDLNPVRAGVAKRLDEAEFTSIDARLREASARMDGAQVARASEGPGADGTPSAPAGLMPFAEQAGDASAPALPMRMSDYVELLEWTGRAVREGQGRLRGAPPAAIARLSIEPEAWLATMSAHGLSRHGALGGLEALEALALRQRQRWVTGKGLARRLFRRAA